MGTTRSPTPCCDNVAREERFNESLLLLLSLSHTLLPGTFLKFTCKGRGEALNISSWTLTNQRTRISTVHHFFVVLLKTFLSLICGCVFLFTEQPQTAGMICWNRCEQPGKNTTIFELIFSFF